jgi:hypothetical protein
VFAPNKVSPMVAVIIPFVFDAVVCTVALKPINKKRKVKKVIFISS